MSLELGNLSLKYSANTSGFSAGMADVRRQVQAHATEMRQLGQAMSGSFQKSLDDTRRAAERSAKDVKKLGEMMFGAFDGAAGGAAKAGEKLSKLSSGIKDIFGDNATAMGQRWGREITSAIGLSSSEIKGLGQAATGASGALKVIAVVAGAISVPVLAVAAAVAGIVVLLETMKNGFTHGFGAAHVAIALLLGPITLMAAPTLLLIAAVKKLVDLWPQIKGPAFEALQAVGNKLAALWEVVKELAAGIGNAFADAATWMVRAMSRGVASLLETAATAFKWIEDNDPTGMTAKAGLAAKASGAAQRVEQAGAGFDGRELVKSAIDTLGAGFLLAKEKLSDGADSLRSGFRSIGSDLASDGKDLKGKVKKFIEDFLAPGTSQADIAKKRAEEQKILDNFMKADLEQRKAADASWQKGMAAEQRGYWESYKTPLQRQAEAAAELQEQLAYNAEVQKKYSDRAAVSAEREAEAVEGRAKIQEQVNAIIQREEQKRQERWQALGSGQIGTAAGIGGVGGAVLNIVGGAAVGQSKYLGGALSGAAQGGEAGGAWGAVIGAVVGLAVQSREFKAILKEVDVILEAVVNALGKVVGALQSLFESLSGLAGLFDMIGGLLNVLTQFDLGMQAVNAIFKAIGQIDFSGATKWFDDAGKSVESWFNGEWVYGTDSVTAGQKAEHEAELEAKRRAKEEQRFQHDVNASRVEGFNGFNDALRQSRIDTILLGDGAYQAAAKEVFLGQQLVQLGQAALDSKNMLDFLNSAQGTEAYVEAQLAALRVQKRQAELDDMVNKKAIEEGLVIDKVTQSLNRFNDAVLNASTGYKYALTAFNAALGVGQGAYTGGSSGGSSGGGGGGGGGGSSGTAGGAGGASTDVGPGRFGKFAGNTVAVTIQSNDAEQIWTKLKSLMQRDNFLTGATPAARAPAFAGGF